MTASNITMRSSKADIVQASEELIGDLDDRLSKEQLLSLQHKEERNTVLYLLAATSAFSMLF